MYMAYRCKCKCIGAEKAFVKIYGRKALCKCIWVEKPFGFANVYD